MKRRTFIKHCGFSAVALSSVTLLSACQTVEVRHVLGELDRNNELSVNKQIFEKSDYVLIENPQSEHPIILFKNAENEYSASLMSCTHQRCTTAVVDEEIVCPCHGARFSKDGRLMKGPADRDLDSYQTRVYEETIFIQL